MATLNLQVTTATTNDSFSWDTTSNVSNNVYVAIGNGGAAIYDCGFRFTNVTIPQGSTINSAYLSVRCRSAYDYDLYTNIRGHDVDNSTACADYDTPTGRIAGAATTASVAWDEADSFTVGWYQSPDIKSVVQEIVDRGGWSSGNALMILWEEDGGGSAEAMQFSDYSENTSYAAKLDIDYTAPADDTDKMFLMF